MSRTKTEWIETIEGVGLHLNLPTNSHRVHVRLALEREPHRPILAVLTADDADELARNLTDYAAKVRALNDRGRQ